MAPRYYAAEVVARGVKQRESLPLRYYHRATYAHVFRLKRPANTTIVKRGIAVCDKCAELA